MGRGQKITKGILDEIQPCLKSMLNRDDSIARASNSKPCFEIGEEFNITEDRKGRRKQQLHESFSKKKLVASLGIYLCEKASLS
jgi:hypothetical protein